MKLTNPSIAAAAMLFALGACPSAGAATFVPLEATATYLHTNGEFPPPPPALALNLAAYGFASGDRITLQVVGDIDNGPGGDVFTRCIGVFSSSNELLSNELLHRVPGALTSDGPAYVTANTYFGNQSTDISEDFSYDVDAVTVTVPDGALYLFVAKHDQLYNDNSDPDHDFGVLIGAAPVPEPATWALWLLGAAVVAGRSRRHAGGRSPASAPPAIA